MRIFADQYGAEYKAKFEAAGIYYEHRLIDDMVAQVTTIQDMQTSVGSAWIKSSLWGSPFITLIMCQMISGIEE